MARKRANLTELLNNLTFKTLYDKYKLICMNEYEWDGLPDDIEARHIERQLFHHGQCIFYKSRGMGFMALEAYETGRQNVYGDPLQYRAVGVGFSEEVWAKDCVIIENNLLRLPTEPFVMHYVNKLTEAERTMDVNVKACKTPIVFACDDRDVLSLKRTFQQVDGNVPAIFADKSLNLDSVEAFQTGAKFLGNELMDYKHAVECDLLTFLGQNNVAVDKKERLITDEAAANDQLIESFAALQLEARERACEAINEHFGLSVTVRRRSEPVEPSEPEQEKEETA